MATHEKPSFLQFEALLTAPCLLKPGWDIPLFEPEEYERIQTPDLPVLPHNLVFGKKMEILFAHYLKSSSRYSLVAENLQIMDDKLTIGELDFLAKDHQTNHTLHIEMACKFYLYREELSADPLACWIGPNGRDRLVDKLDKLRNKQFPLLFDKLTQIHLNALNIRPEECQQLLFFPALLFSTGSYLPLTPCLNTKAISGYWLSFEAFQKSDFDQCLFALPAKENWLIHPKHANTWISRTAAQALILQKLGSRQSPLVWMKNANDEYHRFFVLWW